MMRALFAGVAGLRTHQTKMDVIGNNIANVNTVGFKSSSVIFSDVFYQTTQSSSGPNTESDVGGINSKQIGLGSNVSAISKNISGTGGSQATNNALDCMISGDSFFVVNNAGRKMFTKNGAFTTDADGTLCTQDGAKVQGWQPDKEDPTRAKPDAVSNLNIMSAENMYTAPEATKAAYLSGNIDKNDTQIGPNSEGRTFQVNFYDKLGYPYTAKFLIKQSSTANNAYFVGLQDILMDGKSIFYTVSKGDDGKNVYTATEWGVKLTKRDDSAADPFEPTDAPAVTVEENGKLNFDGDIGFSMIFDGTTGKFKSLKEEGGPLDDTGKVEIDPTVDEGASFGKMMLSLGGKTPNPFSNVEIDFSKLTMFASSSSSTIESTMGDVDGNYKGKMKGTMTGASIDNSGKIYGAYDNGDIKLLGQIATATFKNASGLEAVGSSYFVETMNSGRFDGVGKDVTANGGKISTGVLEMSNVDLAAQFTDMITTQRGFQANSRTITTSDSILEELINLKR